MPSLDSDDAEPLPTDGMQVEEFRDADTVRLFMLEWRRRTCRDWLDRAVAVQPAQRRDGIMRA
jgi:hypothetical protein